MLEQFAKGVPSFWGGAANPDNFSPEMIAEYTATFSDPRTLRAALNWYNGAKNASSLEALYTENDNFTKTGSGQI
jgi:hypothetical protein|eukprot:COSAG06_NODE_4070_length_4606_cov_39.200799_7_plen_75_part_00